MHFLGPYARRCPWLRVRFYRISAAGEKQFHHFDSPPPARPAKRCAFEQVVAHIEPRSGVEQNGGKLKTRAAVARDNLVQYGLAMVGIAVMRSGARQYQLERIAAFGPMGVVPGRPAEHSEPAGIVRRPFDALERHANDVVA